MTKSQFIKKYISLSQEDKNAVKEYYENVLKTAIFTSTFEVAEKTLLWIREADEI